MKIGILTAARTDNNGTDLQAYAMYKLFSKYNPATEIINYVSPKIDSTRNILFHPFKVKKIFTLPQRIIKNINHKLFRKKNFQMSKKITNLNKLNYDLIVTGSDQIWNLKLTNGDLNFFLSFTSNIIKYSYAASFGIGDITVWEKEYKISKYLKEYKKISIRENANIPILKKMGITVREDLDPIMMITKDEWSQIKKDIKIKKGYIFVYLAEETNTAFQLAKNYSKKYNLKIIYNTDGLKPKSGITTKRFIGIEQWISYIENADIIITNSYHCLSMSIIFNKNIIVTKLKNNNTINRLTNIIQKCEIKNDCTFNDEYEELFNIDWNKVNKNIEKLRKKSFKYIEEINNFREKKYDS